MSVSNFIMIVVVYAFSASSAICSAAIVRELRNDVCDVDVNGGCKLSSLPYAFGDIIEFPEYFKWGCHNFDENWRLIGGRSLQQVGFSLFDGFGSYKSSKTISAVLAPYYEQSILYGRAELSFYGMQDFKSDFSGPYAREVLVYGQVQMPHVADEGAQKSVRLRVEKSEKVVEAELSSVLSEEKVDVFLDKENDTHDAFMVEDSLL